MKNIKTYFLTGLVIFLPFLVTVYFLLFILMFFDNILGRYINMILEPIIGFRIFGLGIALLVILIFLVGVFTVNVLGKKILPFLERIFIKIPLVSKIYPAVKQMSNFLLAGKKESFKSVVLVEYPRKGIYSIGFVTNDGFKEAKNKSGVDLLNVFVGSSPTPMSGYYMLVPKNEVIYLDISIEEGMKLIVSGGILNP